MFLDIISLVVLAILSYLNYNQDKRINQLQIVCGYLLYKMGEGVDQSVPSYNEE